MYILWVQVFVLVLFSCIKTNLSAHVKHVINLAWPIILAKPIKNIIILMAQVMQQL